MCLSNKYKSTCGFESGNEKRCLCSSHQWQMDCSWRSASRPVPIHWNVSNSRSQQFRNGLKLGGARLGWALIRKATADRTSSVQQVEKLNQGICDASYGWNTRTSWRWIMIWLFWSTSVLKLGFRRLGWTFKYAKCCIPYLVVQVFKRIILKECLTMSWFKRIDFSLFFVFSALM